MNPALQQTGSRNLTDQKTLAYTKYMFNVYKDQQSRQTGSRNRTFFVTFFSAAIDGRDLIFGH
jgi:hypothetical protein